MQKFFNEALALAGGGFYEAKWKYAKEGLQRNLTKLLDYYDRSHYRVPNQHILVRLLRSISVNMNMPLDRYYDNVDARALFIGRAFKMTSPINAGGLYKGAFYGEGSYEILWASDESINPFEVDSYWKEQIPVTVLMHPQSDLDLTIPDGTGKNAIEGISSISINIPMLAVMYRAFCREQFIRGETGDGMETAAMFVRNHVLPKMLYSQLDVSLFNRFANLAKGAPMTVHDVRHPVFTFDYSSYVDQYFQDLLDYMDKSPRPYGTILQLIPAVTQTNMLEVLRLPDVAETRQVTWAMLLTRLDAIDLLTRVAPDAGNQRNRSDNNYFLRELKLMQNNRILDSIPQEVRYDATRKIGEITSRIQQSSVTA